MNLFFEIYRNTLTNHEYTPMRIWNMDETGISNVHKPTKIVASKGARGVGKINSGEKERTVTVICATNAAGSYIPPMFIFSRKRMMESFMNNAPSGAIGHCTKSGWTDEESFMKWLKHFTSIAKPSKEEKHLIILDGHHSHKTLQAVEFARANGIEMLTLPPHCTHKMQPLDRTFFKSLKSGYNAAADTWMVANRGRKISFNDIAEIFCVAYNKVATVEKSVNGFRVCGLWPFNDHVFSDEDFVEVTTDEHSTSLLQEVQGLAFQEDQQSVGLPTTQQSVSLQVTPQVTEPQTTQQSVGPQTTQKIVSPQPTQQIVESQGIPQIFTPSTQQSVQSERNQTDREALDNEHVDELILDHDTPSTSANAMAQNILTAKRVLFELCTPKPNQARSNAKPQRIDFLEL